MSYNQQDEDDRRHFYLHNGYKPDKHNYCHANKQDDRNSRCLQNNYIDGHPKHRINHYYDVPNNYQKECFLLAYSTNNPDLFHIQLHTEH